MNQGEGLSLYDYFAASIIASAFVWIWGIVLARLPRLPERRMAMLVVFSFFIYALGGAVASYLIVKKSSGRPLVEGIKVGIGIILVLLLIIFPISAERSLGATLAIIFCCFIGSILGTQIPRLKRLFYIIFGKPPASSSKKKGTS